MGTTAVKRGSNVVGRYRRRRRSAQRQQPKLFGSFLLSYFCGEAHSFSVNTKGGATKVKSVAATATITTSDNNDANNKAGGAQERNKDKEHS
jgi:hypothetical protein